MRRIWTCLAFVLVAVGAVGTPSALAHIQGFRSEVTLEFRDLEENFPADGADFFRGQVKSKKAKCLDGRLARVFRKTNDGPVLVGSDTTNDDGVYRVEVENPGNGSYFTKIGRNIIGADDESHLHTCRGDRSPREDIKDDPGGLPS